MAEDYGVPKVSTPQVDMPYSYSKSTSTTFGRTTAWKSRPGVLSKQNFGSVLKFDDDASTPAPQSDKGASFGRG